MEDDQLGEHLPGASDSQRREALAAALACETGPPHGASPAQTTAHLPGAANPDLQTNWALRDTTERAAPPSRTIVTMTTTVPPASLGDDDPGRRDPTTRVVIPVTNERGPIPPWRQQRRHSRSRSPGGHNSKLARAMAAILRYDVQSGDIENDEGWVELHTLKAAVKMRVSMRELTDTLQTHVRRGVRSFEMARNYSGVRGELTTWARATSDRDGGAEGPSATTAEPVVAADEPASEPCAVDPMVTADGPGSEPCAVEPMVAADGPANEPRARGDGSDSGCHVETRARSTTIGPGECHVCRVPAPDDATACPGCAEMCHRRCMCETYGCCFRCLDLWSEDDALPMTLARALEESGTNRPEASGLRTQIVRNFAGVQEIGRTPRPTFIDAVLKKHTEKSEAPPHEPRGRAIKLWQICADMSMLIECLFRHRAKPEVSVQRGWLHVTDMANDFDDEDEAAEQDGNLRGAWKEASMAAANAASAWLTSYESKLCRDIVPHETDAWISREYLPAECFKDATERDRFVEKYRDDRGKLKATQVLQWVFGAGFGRCATKQSWRDYLKETIDLVLQLEWQGRGSAQGANSTNTNEIKLGGQVGEAVHDYGVTEAIRRGGKKVPKFVCTVNSGYVEILDSCSQEIQELVRGVWIRETRRLSNPSRVAEAIGDFFEFFEMYLIGKGLRDELLAFIANTMRVSIGAEAVDKAVDYERTNP